MKRIVIEGVPKGANVLLARDTGIDPVSKEDTIELYQTKEKGDLEFSYGNYDEIIIRVRCAGEDRGYWRPVEVKTKHLEPDSINVKTMEEDSFLGSNPKKTKHNLW